MIGGSADVHELRRKYGRFKPPQAADIGGSSH